jgi:hypothetical protein
LHANKSRAKLAKFWQEGVMKSRKPSQTNAVRKISDAILAEHFLEVQKLRDEVRKAELDAAAKRRGKRLTYQAKTSIKQR